MKLTYPYCCKLLYTASFPKNLKGDRKRFSTIFLIKIKISDEVKSLYDYSYIYLKSISFLPIIMLNVQRDTSSVVPLAFTEKECTPFTPPRNGALVCATKSNTCAVMCRTGTDFESNPPFLYYCSSGVWKFFSLFPFKAGTPGPNCAGKSLNVRDTLLYLYFP